MVTQGKNHRGWKQKLFGLTPRSKTESNAKRIWLHAVSVGEVHLLETLVDQLLKEDKGVQLFISTTTETGYDRATDLFGDKYSVFFFPFDFSWAIRNAISRIAPDLLVLAELELWPNLIHIAADKGLPVMVANGRLSAKSHANYVRLGPLTQPMFRKLTFVGSQNEIYADRFISLGCDPDRVIVTGNLKYDAIETCRHNSKAESCRKIAADFGFGPDDMVLIAGSTQIEDEVAAIDAWKNLRERFSKLKLIIVPRHPSRVGEMENLLAQRGLSAVRRSRQKQQVNESDVLIVDVIGELSGWWALADVAFVGGSMGSRGGQNMIEPAAYGVPVCFGPNTVNFKTTVDGLLACRGAYVVNDANELAGFVARMLSAPDESESVGKRAQAFVQQHRGATKRTVEIMKKVAFTERKRGLERAA